MEDNYFCRRTSTNSILKRGNWANKTEFILSCLGCAVGVSNVWRFPYLCYRNGGGAFLVPYLLMLGLCGIPLFFMETTLGQFGSTGCITIFRLSPLFKGAGYAIVIVNIICTIYYSVIVSYPLLFLVNSVGYKLPWVDCTNPWNTPNCVEMGSKERILNESLLHIFENQTTFRNMKTPADEFFHNQILQISDGIESPGGVVWKLFLCSVVTWIVMYICIMNGVKSVGKVVYITATFPFIILFILLIRGVTLPGAWQGIVFYIYPKWDQLINLKVWADAAIQIFFSLGPGWGTIINMSSYNNFRNNNKGDSILIALINCGTSIFAGFVVFSIIGFMAHETGLPVSKVASGGPGLAFITYPEAIAMLPLPQLWAVLFFIMFFLLGLDSCFALIETIISSIIDEYPTLRSHKKLVGLICCLIMFVGSISCLTNGGMYVVQLLDWYAASISVILICLVEVFIVGWSYGCKNFVRDLEFMIRQKVHWWWPLCWRYTAPVILTFIFSTTIIFNTPVSYNGVMYPPWAITVGWLSCTLSIICIPIYMIYKLCISSGSFKQRIKSSVKVTAEWGPAEEEHRKEWMTLRGNKDSLLQMENV